MGVVLLVCSDITKLSVAVIFAMGLPTTSSHTHQGCVTTPAIPTVTESDEWLEQYVAAGFKVWQIMFLCFAGLLTIVIFLCCCIRFRIPRTKQEIEADYIRKKITKKFQKQLKIIQNSEMDNMDLKRGEGCSFSGCVQSESGQTDALDRIRAEFKSDTESLAQSEALSGATLSSGCNCQSPGQSSPVRPSEDHVGINMEDASAAQTKPGTRFSFLAESLSKLRPKKQ